MCLGSLNAQWMVSQKGRNGTWAHISSLAEHSYNSTVRPAFLYCKLTRPVGSKWGIECTCVQNKALCKQFGKPYGVKVHWGAKPVMLMGILATEVCVGLFSWILTVKLTLEPKQLNED